MRHSPGRPAISVVAVAPDGHRVALVAGVSVYGGRGGIFGVVLASGIAAVIAEWIILSGGTSWAQEVLEGVMILLGLLVGWAIGLIARRVPA